MTLVREARPQDLEAAERILAASPEAGRWPGIELAPTRRCLVAEAGGRVIGFLLAQCPVEEEAEILALAVEPPRRRLGVATLLLEMFLASRRGRVWLEVRESNTAARELYGRRGFVVARRRRWYYQSPSEDALVMQLVLSQ